MHLSRRILVALVLLAVPLLGAAEARSALTEFGVGDSSAIYTYAGSPSPEQLATLQAQIDSDVARITMHWNVVEAAAPSLGGQATYDWSSYDPTIAALLNRGIKPLIVLYGTPSWARDPLCGTPSCPPSELRLSQYRKFVAAVVSRYPQIRGVEIWNEPNYAGSWTGLGPDPNRYARLYNAAARGVADVWPGKSVIIGGLGYVPPGGNQGMPIKEFLEGFYDSVNRSLLNAGSGIGVHAYPGPGEVEQQQLKPQGQFNTILSEVRQVRDSRDPHRLLFITETGVSTTAIGPDGIPVSSEEQRSAVENVLDVLDVAPDVKAAVLYTMVDRAPAPNTPSEEGYGLVKRTSFEPKLAYCSLAARRAMPAPPGC